MAQPAQRLGMAPPPQPPGLLDRVRAAVRARHYSIRTEEAYVGWIRRFILFYNKRHPAEMGESEIKQFLTHLAVRTTMIYTHVLNRGGRGVLCPADKL